MRTLPSKEGASKLEKIKADNISIGGIWRKEKNFSVQERELKDGEVIYLFTDGFADQCNPERRRFSTARLVEQIELVREENLIDQAVLLEKKLEEFQLSAEQRDDITVVGLKV